MDGSAPERPLMVLALTQTHDERTLTWLSWHLRVEVLLPHLAQHGIHVETRELPRKHRARRAFLSELPPHDIAWLHRLLLWPSEMRPLRRAARHVVLDIDDPICYSSSNLGNFSLSRCVRFRTTTRHCSAVFAASDGLVRLARAHARNVCHVPLCAELETYPARPSVRAPGEPLRLLWLGGRSTFKYLQGARPQLEAIGQQCPLVTLTVVGHQELQLKHLPVHNLPWNQVNESAALGSCHVGLAPVYRDRWTEAKATLKPLQYLASGMPFLGSSVGVNVRLADEGRNALLADTPSEWVAAVKTLAANEALRQQMGVRGAHYVQQYHTAAPLAARIAAAFQALVPTWQPQRNAAMDSVLQSDAVGQVCNVP